MRQVRGAAIGMIFQNPASHLDPVMRIGEQIAESLRVHQGMSPREARAQAVDLLRQVGIPDPQRRVDDLSAPILRRHAPARDDRRWRLPAGPSSSSPTSRPPPSTSPCRRRSCGCCSICATARGLAIILITPRSRRRRADLRCDRRHVCRPDLRARPTSATCCARPLHPYTAGLIGCQPARPPAYAPLPSIPGQPPSPAACRAAAASIRAAPTRERACRTEQPPLVEPDPGHRDRVPALAHPAGRGVSVLLRLEDLKVHFRVPYGIVDSSAEHRAAWSARSTA